MIESFSYLDHSKWKMKIRHISFNYYYIRKLDHDISDYDICHLLDCDVSHSQFFLFLSTIVLLVGFFILFLLGKDPYFVGIGFKD